MRELGKSARKPRERRRVIVLTQACIVVHMARLCVIKLRRSVRHCERRRRSQSARRECDALNMRSFDTNTHTFRVREMTRVLSNQHAEDKSAFAGARRPVEKPTGALCGPVATKLAEARTKVER